MTAPASTPTLAGRLEQEAHVRVADCYQCGKCSAGCPVADEMDVMPSRILRMLQLELPWHEEQVAARSQRDLDVRRLRDLRHALPEARSTCPGRMDFLRKEALARGVAHRDARDVIAFHRAFLHSIETVRAALRAGHDRRVQAAHRPPVPGRGPSRPPCSSRARSACCPTARATERRPHLRARAGGGERRTPHGGPRRRAAARREPRRPMRLGYFPGCSLLGSSRDFGESVSAVARALEVELVRGPRLELLRRELRTRHEPAAVGRAAGARAGAGDGRRARRGRRPVRGLLQPAGRWHATRSAPTRRCAGGSRT